jgi:hypothetical protein
MDEWIEAAGLSISAQSPNNLRKPAHSKKTNQSRLEKKTCSLSVLRYLSHGSCGVHPKQLLVRISPVAFLTVYHHIFTALSSASSKNTSEISSRHCDIATSLGLNGCITLWSIAYTATQVCYLNIICYWSLTLSL